MSKSKLAIGLLCLLLIFMSGSMILANKNETDSNEVTVGFRYTICEYNGNVAVYKYGGKEPQTILDCKINSLPEADAENIRQGINIRTDDELQQLIEAFD